MQGSGEIHRDECGVEGVRWPHADSRSMRTSPCGPHWLKREQREEGANRPRRPLAQRLELGQNPIEQHEVVRPIGHGQALLVEPQRRGVSAPLLCLGTCLIDADLAHRAAGDRKEVPPVVPLRTRGAEQLEVGLVHERDRLERVTGAHVRKLAMHSSRSASAVGNSRGRRGGLR